MKFYNQHAKLNLRYITIGLLFITSLSVLAQDVQTEAKFLFKKVSEEIDKKIKNGETSYSYSLDKQLYDIERLLGETNAALEYYRAKMYAQTKNVRFALRHIKKYFEQDRSNELWDTELLELKYNLKERYPDYVYFTYRNIPGITKDLRMPSSPYEREDGKVEMISVDGKFRSGIYYDQIRSLFMPPSYDGLIRARKDDKKVWIDSNGTEVLENEFQDSDSFWSEGYLAVSQNGKWGFINERGNLVVTCQFDKIDDFKYGLGYVSKDGRKLVVDNLGFKIFEVENKMLEIGRKPSSNLRVYFHKSLIILKDEKGCSFLDKSGVPVNDKIYEDCYGFSDELAPVKLNGKWGFINRNFNLVIQPLFLRTGGFHEGVAAVQLREDLVGYIDFSGSYVIPPFESKYWDSFYDGLSRRFLNGKYGFMDINGEMIIYPKFDGAERFVNGFTWVKKYGHWALIDKNGNYKTNIE